MTPAVVEQEALADPHCIHQESYLYKFSRIFPFCSTQYIYDVQNSQNQYHILVRFFSSFDLR